MRTTVSIDEDVLANVRRLARRQRRPLGAVVTDLLRGALQPRQFPGDGAGLPVMPVQPGAGRATLDLVNALRDELA